MKYVKEFVFSTLAILMASCSFDNETPEQLPASKSFTASIESGNVTRTALNSNTANDPYPVWSSDDQIKVINTATNDVRYFNLSSEAGQRAATFDGTIKVEDSGNEYYAVYSGDINAENTENGPVIAQSGSNVTISGTIPSVQPSTPGFHSNLHFMTAYTTGTAFKFKNAMSLLKIYISNNTYDNFGICKIVFKSNKADDKIAGDFTANISGTDGTLSGYSVTNGSPEITIGDGTTPLSTGYYYIAILPCDFENGFTLTYLDERDNNKKQYDRIKTTSFPVAASEIINLGSYTAKDVAKEAYVDLEVGSTSTKWCIENVYDDETDKTSTRDASYYSWGETLVKANQEKYSDTYRQYAWYFNYGVAQGSDDDDAYLYRCYDLGLGAANWLMFTTNESYDFIHTYVLTSMKGVLIKYNSSNNYIQSSADWRGGVNDGKTELEFVDDAAYQKSAQQILRIPSEADFNALKNAITNGTLELTKVSSTYKIKNKTTGYFITLPAAGYRFKSSSSGNDNPQSTSTAAYWTRDRSSAAADSYKARSFNIASTSSITITDEERAGGRLLRAVVVR